jgi:hypothetical protein
MARVHSGTRLLEPLWDAPTGAKEAPHTLSSLLYWMGCFLYVEGEIMSDTGS